MFYFEIVSSEKNGARLKLDEGENVRGQSFKRIAVWIFLAMTLAIAGQQCADVPLERYEEIEFLSLGKNPFRLDPPVDYPQVRRFVFLVDMSQSMVSGPCIQDVDEEIGFSTTPLYQVYDPNKGTGNASDHRATGIDCKVNPQLPISRSSIINKQPQLLASPPVFFETHLGTDHEVDRVEIVRNWIMGSLENNPDYLIRNTKVMLIPVSGGISQITLDSKWKKITGDPTTTMFYDIDDPRLLMLLDWMKKEHQDNLQLATSNLIWRYKDRTMGSSSPGTILPMVYDSVQKDMRELNTHGKLYFADYQIIPITDGFVTPVEKHLRDVLNFYAPCSYCASRPETCNATCETLVQRLHKAWGYPEDNDPKKMDLYFGLLETLPYYFGAGHLRVDFVQLHKDRTIASYPGKPTFFEELKPLFEARSKKLSLWQANSAKTPFRLVGDSGKTASYKVTDLFILNPNVRVDRNGNLRVDSDGDGLFDDEETGPNFNPRLARTNDYCLDSFMAEPAFAARCEAMAKARSCDPTVDSDGDGLNECEENLLGTDPFDFDTDNDGIPDFYEWIYGFNPLSSDQNLDSNGDGYLNKMNFSAGIGPSLQLSNLDPRLLVHFERNFRGKETLEHEALGVIMTELHEVIVRAVPAKEGLVLNPADLPPVYVSRVGSSEQTKSVNRIPYSDQLLTQINSPGKNTIVALARIKDLTNPERVYWRIYKTEVAISQVYKQPQLDLSLFRMLRTRDASQ